MTMLDADHGLLMDRVYRHQRHVYDVTRKCYLVGRDRLIAELDPPVAGRVLEIGCGTGRNLFAASDRYPLARFYGIDISMEMLATALRRSQRHSGRPPVAFAHADATTFDPQATFGIAGFDRIFMSYALSMIPGWKQALRRAASALDPGGSLHIVDFGQQERLPRAFRSGLFAWLSCFHVAPRAQLRRECAELAASLGGELQFCRLYGGYAWSLRLAMPATPSISSSPASDAAAGRTADARAAGRVSPIVD